MLQMTENKIREQGFGLIEVLIAMVIISIGLLGILVLNASLKLTIDASYRQQAGILIQNLANRMKVNFVDARKGTGSQYHKPGGLNGSNTTNPGCTFPNTSGSINCNNAQMAQFDLYQIYQLLTTGSTTPSSPLLPNGSIVVCLDSSTNGSCNGGTTNGVNVFTIKVSWTAPNGQNESMMSTVGP